MLYVCHSCGEYRPDKIIDPSGPFAICPLCNHKHLFQMRPLLVVGGASSTGKTSVLNKLIGKINEVVLLEGDIIWRSEFNKPDEKYRDFFETWLRICLNISQSGRSVVLFNAGMVVPDNIEQCIGRRYFSEVHYLALTSEKTEIEKRLRERPDWRQSNDSSFIEQQITFNQWLINEAENTNPKITLLDTTQVNVDTSVKEVAAWINGIIG